jgi:hypothetical protein
VYAALLSALLAFSLYFFFRGVDLGAVAAAFHAADPLGLLAVAVIAVGTYVRAWRWGDLLAPLGRVPFERLFSATLVGFMTGLVIPRAESCRAWWRAAASCRSQGLASIIVERLVDLITVLGLFNLYLYVPAPAQLQRA